MSSRQRPFATRVLIFLAIVIGFVAYVGLILLVLPNP